MSAQRTGKGKISSGEVIQKREKEQEHWSVSKPQEWQRQAVTKGNWKSVR